jgi:hypothetical protein
VPSGQLCSHMSGWTVKRVSAMNQSTSAKKNRARLFQSCYSATKPRPLCRTSPSVAQVCGRANLTDPGMRKLLHRLTRKPVSM